MKYILSFFYCIAAFTGTAQFKSNLTSLSKIDIGLNGVGFTYEPKLGNYTTIELSAGLGGAYNISEGTLEYYLNEIGPYFSIQPKFYFNLAKRARNGKSGDLNAGNFIGAIAKFVAAFDSYNTYPGFLYNVHWGMQRAIARRWTINTRAGIGYAIDADFLFGTLYPAFDVKFSYVFRKKKI